MTYLDPPEPGQDIIYRPTVGINLFYRAGVCGCTVVENIPPKSHTVMPYRDIRCLEHDNPMIPYET